MLRCVRCLQGDSFPRHRLRSGARDAHPVEGVRLGARVAMGYILTGVLLSKVVRCPMMIERCSRSDAGHRRAHAVKLLLALGVCAVPWFAGAQPSLPRVQVSLGACGAAV